jgi:hypothetical protein
MPCHQELRTAGVTIDCLFADPGTDAAEEPLPLKLGGYPVAAYVRRIGLKDRAKGMADAEIVIDANTWKGLAEAKRVALIDHEVTHLRVKQAKDGGVDRDDLGRPKLVMRLHDHQIGIFKDVIERHGKDALDHYVAKEFTEDMGQLLMWAEDKRKVG